MSGKEFRLLIKGSGFTVEEVADKIGKSRQTLQTYFNHAEVDEEIVQNVRTKLKLTEIVATESTSKKSSSTANAVLLEENEYVVMMIPLVNKYAYAGYQAGFGDDEYIESLPRVPMMANKEHKGKYFAFEVKGDSMDNGLAGSYQEGMILHARELPKPHWKDKLHIHKWKNWVIVTKADGILFKQIINHDRGSGIITLHSLNEEYKDFEMNLENVAQLLNVVGGNFK